MPTTDAPGTRTDTHDMDVDATVSAIIVDMCDRLGLRSYEKGRHLAAVMRDMIDLAARGAGEADLNAFGLSLLSLARTLKSQDTTDDKTLARLQLDADIADDHLRGVIAIDGESPSMLDAYASALEKTASLNVAKARRMRRRARQIRSGRTVARQQMGLGGAA